MDDPTIPGWVLVTATFIGTMIAAFAARMGWRDSGAQKAAARTDAVIAGVGIGYGSSEQIERLIQAVNAVAQAVRDKRQDEMQDTMTDLLEELKRQGRAP